VRSESVSDAAPSGVPFSGMAKAATCRRMTRTAAFQLEVIVPPKNIGANTNEENTVAKNEPPDRGPTDDKLRAAYGHLLAALPGPEDDSVRISDVANELFRAGVASSRTIAMGTATTLFILLEQFGLVGRPHPDFVQAVSDNASTFLHSLGEYLKAGLPLLGDWRSSGATLDGRRHRNLIGLLEEHRIERQGESAPASRRIEAVAAIIKGQIAGRHVYLVQENPVWELKWWVGGILEKADPTPEKALCREIEEELGVSPSAVKTIQQFTELRYFRMSARLHAKTEYHTHFYEVTFNEQAVPAKRFDETNELTTIDRTGREFRRRNSWLTWERFCSQPEFDFKAGDIAASLAQRGIARLGAPHAITASVRPAEAAMSVHEPVKKSKAQVAGMLRGMHRIVLSDCAVIAKYLRYDQVVRNELKDWAWRIISPLRTKTNQEMNFLIWAPSGSGKTFFIQQIAAQLKAELGGNFEFVECNLAKQTREEFTNQVNSVESKTQPVLCLLDEIDTHADEKWPYEVCFAKLELNTNPDKRVVFVLMGSTEANLNDMVKSMEKRHKGPDLLNRMLRDHNSFQIPRATPEDVTAMVVGEIVDHIGERVRAVEKLALCYILFDENYNSSPHQIRELIKSAASRFQAHEERLRFYHLFHPEDEKKKHAFLMANEGLFDEFLNKDIQVTR
jgi:hypothetical protein